MYKFLTKDICDLSDEEIKELKLPEYVKLERSEGYNANSMFIVPTVPQETDPDTFYPIMVYANKHQKHLIDKTKPFKSQQDCIQHCNTMNNKLGHSKLSMFMLLESIRLETLLRNKLRLTGELKIKSDYIIRESAGFKFILFDKGNGIITTASINDALNYGLAAIKREKNKTVIEKTTTKCVRIGRDIKRNLHTNTY